MNQERMSEGTLRLRLAAFSLCCALLTIFLGKLLLRLTWQEALFHPWVMLIWPGGFVLISLLLVLRSRSGDWFHPRASPVLMLIFLIVALAGTWIVSLFLMWMHPTNDHTANIGAGIPAALSAAYIPLGLWIAYLAGKQNSQQR